MQPTPSSAPPYPQPPQGYVAASSQSYTPPNLHASSSSNTTSDQPYDYGASLDPALAASLQSKSPDMYNGLDGQRQQTSASPYAPTAPGAGAPGGQPFHLPSTARCSLAALTNTDPSVAAKRSRMDELVCLDGISPPPPTGRAIEPEDYGKIKLAYQNVYGPSIDKFLETQWFSQSGIKYLMEDRHLCERFARLIDRYHIDPQSPGAQHTLAPTMSLEASVIWSLMNLARRVTDTADPSSDAPEGRHSEASDAAKRVSILENLLSGQHLEAESAPAVENTRNGTAFEIQLNKREHDFWQLLHTFLTIHDDEASASQELDSILNSARLLLDSRENRDIVYSIAILRLHGSRESLETSGGGNTHNHTLQVAKDFLQKEAGNNGTTQVVQRLCGMAMNAWVTLRR
ncbi:MAG: hypothetical protein Q9174_001301 [Haloplaca sp. 1 TL-2023]